MRALVPILAALGLGLAPAAASASDVTPQQLSNNALQDLRPRVAGGQVLWQRGPDASSEIDLFDGAATTPLTSNAFRDFDPWLSSTHAIWKRSSDGTTCQLRFDDLTDANPSDVAGSDFPCDRDIRLAGPHAIWTDPAPLNTGDIVMLSTDAETPEQLGLDFVDEDLPRVGNLAGAPRAIWTNDEDLVYFDGTDETPIAALPIAQPQMQGARAVWIEDDGNDTEVWLFTGTGSPQQLTDNDYDDEEPQLNGPHVVWTGFPDSSGEGEIFHFNGTTTVQVTDDDLDDRQPQVSIGPDGPTLAWVKNDGDDEIWVFDGCESTAVTDNAVADRDVALDENQVAWVRGTGTGAEIWTASVVCDVACGNGEEEPGEECDDGNTLPDDGCDPECFDEICGNGRLQPPDEECDDGNTETLDGCDADCLLECGNGVEEGDEECDDGNRVGGDDCDAECFDEICGNGHVQPAIGEECDDGNTVAGDGCSDLCALEEPIPPAQQKCIQKLNESGAAVAKAGHKVDLLCLSAAATGDLGALGVPTAQGCLSADPKGKVAKAQTKTLNVDTEKCSDVPPFAYEGAVVVNVAGAAAPVDLMADVFGADLDAAVIAKAVDPAGAKCQKNVAKATTVLADRLFKLTFKEKKALLAGKDDGSLAISDAALALQLVEFIDTDPGDKIARKETELRNTAQKSCAGVGLDAAFPGCAPSASTSALADCATRAARCRFCLALDAFDGLAVDCDLLDNGTADVSCP